METRHISPRSKQCDARFQRLCSALSSTPDYGAQLVLANDSSERFNVWASNLGAYHEPSDHRSADYRLREANSISRLIVQYLDELLDALDNAADIANGIRPDGCLLDIPEEDLGEDDEEDVPETEDTELGELCGISSDIVTDLLKVSILIRQSTDRDRYAKAAASGDPFLRDIDIRRIGERFPKIADRRRADLESTGDEGRKDEDHRHEDQQDEYAWLRDRLGNANVQRRQFLRYAKYHQNRIANASTAPQAPKMLSALNQPALNLTPRPPSQAPSSRPTLAPTDSSTINVAKLPEDLSLPVLEQANDVDDSLSFVSSQSPTDNEDAEHKHRVVGLADVSNGHMQFECPYCRAIIQPGTRSKWKKHVFSDLRAYVCTFEDCSAGLFEDRQEWFRHELECHRRRWTCQVCSRNFSRSLDLEAHLRKVHSDRLPMDSMIGSMVATSSRPMVALQPSDCPLCDEWSRQKREQADEEGIPAQQTIAVRPDEFRRHLGEHMEQIALFAIPPALDAQSISGSEDGGNKTENAKATITRWQHGTQDVDKAEPSLDDSQSVASSREGPTSTGNSEDEEYLQHQRTTNISEDRDTLVDMGFDRWKATIALRKGGNLQGAIDWLDKNQETPLDDLRASWLLSRWHLAIDVVRATRKLLYFRRLTQRTTMARAELRQKLRNAIMQVFRKHRFFRYIRGPIWLYSTGSYASALPDNADTKALGDWFLDWRYGEPRVLVYDGNLTLSGNVANRLASEQSAAVIWCSPAFDGIERMYMIMLAQLLWHQREEALGLRVLHHGWDFDLKNAAEFRAAFLAVIEQSAVNRVYLILGGMRMSDPDANDLLAFVRELAATGRVSTLIVSGKGVELSLKDFSEMQEMTRQAYALTSRFAKEFERLAEEDAWQEDAYSFADVVMALIRAVRVRNRWLPRLNQKKISQAPYEKVSVLLISWASESGGRNSEAEVVRLQVVLEQAFRYQVAGVQLQPERGIRELLTVMTNFVQDNDDTRSLLVVYYIGAIFAEEASDPGDIRFTLSARDSFNSVSWSEVENIILGCRYADSLLIFDCSEAGKLCKTQSRTADSNVKYQILAACGENERNRIAGKHSFMNAFIWAMEDLARERSSFTTSQLRRKIMGCPDFAKEQMPVLSKRGNGNLLGDIVLHPRGALQNEGRLAQGGDNYAPRVHQCTECGKSYNRALDLRGHLDEVHRAKRRRRNAGDDAAALLTGSGNGNLAGDILLHPRGALQDEGRVSEPSLKNIQIFPADRIRSWMRARILRTPDWLRGSASLRSAEQLERFARRKHLLGDWYSQWLRGSPTLMFCWGYQARSLAAIAAARLRPEVPEDCIRICYFDPFGSLDDPLAALTQAILAQLLHHLSTQKRLVQLLHHIWNYDVQNLEAAILQLLPLFHRVCLILDSPHKPTLSATLSMLGRLTSAGNLSVLMTMKEESKLDLEEYGFKELNVLRAISGVGSPVHTIATLFVVLNRAKERRRVRIDDEYVRYGEESVGVYRPEEYSKKIRRQN